jgi:hypothetical protein
MSINQYRAITPAKFAIYFCFLSRQHAHAVCDADDHDAYQNANDDDRLYFVMTFH